MEMVRKAGNLYRAGWNNWQALKTYQLPTPRVKTETHSPAGGILDVEVPLGAIEPLALGFNLIGAHPNMVGSFGMQLSHAELYTVYELLQDERSGQKRERIVTMRGVMAEVTPEEMSARGLKGYGYQIKSITEFEDVIEGYGIIARFNFWTNSWSGYGVEVGNDDNRILRING